MTTKRHAKEKSDGFASKATKKRHTKREHSPALTPVPRRLEDLLKLANLLPKQFRQPYWARRSSSQTEISKFGWYLDMQISGEATNDLKSELSRFRHAIEDLPKVLVAFILQDHQGEIFNIDDHPTPTYLDSDLQTERNFEVLSKSETEINQIIQNSLQRLMGSIEMKKGSPTTADFFGTIAVGETQFFVVPLTELLERARQRMFFVLAVQETLSCLTHPDAWIQILHYRRFSRLSDTTQGKLYIAQQGENKGRLAFRPPVLYASLAGIEAARIRECQICYDLFWAGRKDMRCCSKKCAHVLRQREYREEYRANRYELSRKRRTKKAN